MDPVDGWVYLNGGRKGVLPWNQCLVKNCDKFNAINPDSILHWAGDEGEEKRRAGILLHWDTNWSLLMLINTWMTFEGYSLKEI